MEFLDRTSRDVDVSFDVYPYQPGSTMINYLLPYDVWEDGPLATIGKLTESGVRARFADGLAAMRLPLDRIRIAWLQSKENAHWQGKTLLEFVEASRLSAAECVAGSDDRRAARRGCLSSTRATTSWFTRSCSTTSS